jgi:hypothetical protein
VVTGAAMRATASAKTNDLLCEKKIQKRGIFYVKRSAKSKTTEQDYEESEAP